MSQFMRSVLRPPNLSHLPRLGLLGLRHPRLLGARGTHK
jgi:hypothetical protein